MAATTAIPTHATTGRLPLVSILLWAALLAITVETVNCVRDDHSHRRRRRFIFVLADRYPDLIL
jgi:hypothetical protein